MPAVRRKKLGEESRDRIEVEVIPAADGDGRCLEEARRLLAREVLRRLEDRRKIGTVEAAGLASGDLRTS